MAMGTALQQSYFLTNSSVDGKINHASHRGQVKIEARTSPSLSPILGDELRDDNVDRDAPSPFQFGVDGNAQAAYQQQMILEHQHQQHQQLLRQQQLLQNGYPSSVVSFAFKQGGYGHGVAQGLSHDQPPPSASSSSIASSSSNSLFSVNGRGAPSPARSDPSSAGGDSVVQHPPIAAPAPLYRFGTSTGSQNQNIGHPSSSSVSSSAHNHNHDSYASAYTPATASVQQQLGQQRHSSSSNRSGGGFSSSSKAGGGSGGNSPQSWIPAQQQQQFLAQQQQQQQLRYQQEQQLRLLDQQQHLASSQFLSSNGKTHTTGGLVGQHLGRQHLSNSTHHHSPSAAQPQPHHHLSSANTPHLNPQLDHQTALHTSHHTSGPSGLARSHQVTPLQHSHFAPSHHHTHGAGGSTLAHRVSSGSLNGLPMSYSDDYDGYNDFDDVNEIPARELGSTFAGLASGGTALNAGISLEGGGSMADDREAQRQRDRARDREQRERDMDRGMTERERTVRRRSSKACDQCRKSKCKCERASPSDPCKNCIMLGTPCTFLGPSRKRGPPKGYIDAIEARLHQTEALLGIMLSTRDERARSLLKDIGKDPLAREIISRVDNSPYGVKGRKDNGSLTVKAPGRTIASTSGTMGALLGAGPEDGSRFATDEEDDEGDAKMDDMLVVSDSEGNIEGGKFDLTSTHPSNEWQDRVSSMLDARAAKIAAVATRTNTNTNAVASSSSPDPSASHADVGSSGGVQHLHPSSSHNSSLRDEYASATGRRTRRRVGEAEYDMEDDRDLTAMMYPAGQGQERDRPDSSYRDRDSSNANAHMLQNKGGATERHSSASNVPLSTTRLLNHSRSRANIHRAYSNPARRSSSPSDSDDSDNLEGAIGKLSINEDDQVRYHGKASGLYLLAATSSDPASAGGTGMGTAGDHDPASSPDIDASTGENVRPRRGRREDGIWRFPKARVWPPLPTGVEGSEEVASMYVASGQGGSLAAGNLQYAPSLRQSAGSKSASVAILPPREVQTHLLALYFAHVQPIFPIVHKKAFWEGYNALMEQIDTGEAYRASPQGANYASAEVHSPLDQSTASRPKKYKPVSALLLFGMFAVASRYDERFSPPKPIDPARALWTAGDEYLDRAHKELASTHGVSHGNASGHCAETVQALLLLSYREIGIGAMAQAWSYVGWAIRMAQDLGMHRSAEGWERGDREPVSDTPGGGDNQGKAKDSRKRQPIFTAQELSERKRIWYGCIVMDTYASTYIGRPLMIFEWDYDTPLPDPEEVISEEIASIQELNEPGKDSLDSARRLNEEWEKWTPEQSPDGQPTRRTFTDLVVGSEGMPSRAISCFNAAATLSGILGTILQTVYAVRPVSSRHGESVVLEGVLDKWYLSLPEHLRFEPTTCAKALTLLLNGKANDQAGATPIRVPPAHVLTLHMQYWCAVLLLHRPFIRQAVSGSRASGTPVASPAGDQGGGKPSGQSSADSEKADAETNAMAQKSFELCNAAANHITSLVALYQEMYVITHCPAYLNYYVFTATIAHDITLTVHPGDPQAKTGLQRCIRALRSIGSVWAGSARAIELFGRARIASVLSDEAQAAQAATNAEAASQHHKRVASPELGALSAAPSGQLDQIAGHSWSAPNVTPPAGIHVQLNPSATIPLMQPVTSPPVNVAFNQTDNRQQPANPLQPQYDYSSSAPQSAIYSTPGIYKADKTMSILGATSSANDSFYRLHPQSSARTTLGPDVRPGDPQYQQQQPLPSAFNQNPYVGPGDSSGALSSWQSTSRSSHPDLTAMDTAVQSAYLGEPPLSMAALPNLYHNTGIVDQAGLGFQQQDHEQYTQLPQQHYAQHPSSLALDGATTRRAHPHRGNQPFHGFENFDPAYASHVNIVSQQSPSPSSQPQNNIYPPGHEYGLYNNTQYYNNQ